MLYLNYMDLPEGKAMRVQSASGRTVVKSIYDAVETLSYLGHAKKFVEEYMQRGVRLSKQATKGFPTMELTMTSKGMVMDSNTSPSETHKLICDAIEETKKAFR